MLRLPVLGITLLKHFFSLVSFYGNFLHEHLCKLHNIWVKNRPPSISNLQLLTLYLLRLLIHLCLVRMLREISINTVYNSENYTIFANRKTNT